MTSSDVIATCSVAVALLAFFATTWQAWLAHKHNRLSVRPFLAWHINRDSSSDGATITYSVKNLGLGPAVVKDRYFTKDGARFATPTLATDEVSVFLSSVLENKLRYQLRTFGLPGRGAAIPSQGEVVIGRIHFPGARTEQLDSFEEMAGDVDFHVEYESMYQERFYFSALHGNAA